MKLLTIVNNDRPSNHKMSQLSGQNYLGIVSTSHHGKAKFVTQKSINFKVYNQASHVPYLTNGDEVLYTLTEYGAYILARSCQRHESPSICLQQINNEQAFIRFGKCKLLLDKSGEIYISNAHAEIKLHDHSIQITANDGYIDFNTPTSQGN